MASPPKACRIRAAELIPSQSSLWEIQITFVRCGLVDFFIVDLEVFLVTFLAAVFLVTFLAAVFLVTFLAAVFFFRDSQYRLKNHKPSFK
jgi:hypothetical protein